MSEDLFKKIIKREIPADIVYETDHVLAFKDINAKAPIHMLVVPKKQIKTLNEIKSEDAMLLGNLILAAVEIAKQNGISEDGYRLVINCGEAAGQTVLHLHMHVLGGRDFTWPPG